MKLTFTLTLLFIICSYSNSSFGQNLVTAENIEYSFTKNDSKNPCITTDEYTILDKQCLENRRRLGLDKNTQKSTLSTSLIWPLRAAAGFTDKEYHFIGAYVDQNKTAGVFSDYNCENNTYDSHQGTDIAIWPYGFYKMDNSQVEVIAAAPGTIIQRADGNFDRNCAKNSLTANSIIIQHADGSQALYWHMKKNSVTSKIVGQTVVAGEYLGVVGSSGSASGPHLHFEIRAGNTSDTYKDPFSGTCNLLNANSWWTSQKPHSEPVVMKVSVNTTDVVMPGCPTTETSNESNSYTIPFQGAGLPAGYAKFYIFLREIPAGSTIDLKILNPDGSVFNSWTYSVATLNKISYWGFSKKLPTNAGTYTFQSSYKNVLSSRKFDIVNPLGIPKLSDSELFQVFPNPISNSFNIAGENIENGNYSFTLTNIAGQIIKSENSKIDNNRLQKSFSVSELSNGVYFMTIDGEKTRTIKKLLKQ